MCFYNRTESRDLFSASRVQRVGGIGSEGSLGSEWGRLVLVARFVSYESGGSTNYHLLTLTLHLLCTAATTVS
jgi:hypothetical protein